MEEEFCEERKCERVGEKINLVEMNEEEERRKRRAWRRREEGI